MKCLRLFPTTLAALLLPVGAFATTSQSFTMTVDTTTNGATVPADFIGCSISTDNISGGNGYTQIFSPANANYSQLQALFKQIGIHHIRTINGNGSTSDPDPSGAQITNFFNFASSVGITGKEIIFSLHLYADSGYNLTTGNQAMVQNIYPAYAAQLQSFAMGNEMDFPGNRPGGTTYANYKTQWESVRTAVNQAISGTTFSFSGPDTGSSYPITANQGVNPAGQDTSVGGPGGVPWTLQFVRDEHGTNLQLGSQHLYDVYSESPVTLPAWTSGMYIGQYDIIQDPKDPNHPGAFYISNSAGVANTHPSAVPSRWTLTTAANAVCQPGLGTNSTQDQVAQGKGIWTSGTSYVVGDEVQDPLASNAGGANPPVNYTTYLCKAATSGTTNPAKDGTHWSKNTIRNCAGPVECVAAATSPLMDSNFATLNSAALMGNHTPTGWPSGIGYRLTEASAFDGGQDPGCQVFSSALLGLDMFHFFALHYCSGVNPFTRLAQTNAPIFSVPNPGGSPSTNDVAAPYAYAMLAFNLGAAGNIERPVTLPSPLPSGVNVTAYATGTSANGDVYVTIINKTYTAAGAVDVNVTIDTTGFSTTSATSMILQSDSDGDGSAEMVATLGGATIPNDGTSFAGTWASETNVSGGVCTVTVPASSAKIIHLHH